MTRVGSGPRGSAPDPVRGGELRERPRTARGRIPRPWAAKARTPRPGAAKARTPRPGAVKARAHPGSPYPVWTVPAYLRTNRLPLAAVTVRS
ncbi:hypothetical protein GCM10010331_41250 [Streptomyces xanthochromogenes]|nr:hypothetical protein GCM10010331_41250 [Streptomyces xanthochromogenes]